MDMKSKPVVPDIPDGFSIRNYRHPEDLEAFVKAVRESFFGTFGWVEESFEKELAQFRRWFNTDELFDPELFFLIISDATNEIVGHAIGLKHDHSDPSVGYIGYVGVRPAYRRRGLAQALMYRTLLEYWKHAMKSITLSVDSESGAVGLYEGIGMVIHRQQIRYEKVIREGQEAVKSTTN